MLALEESANSGVQDSRWESVGFIRRTFHVKKESLLMLVDIFKPLVVQHVVPSCQEGTCNAKVKAGLMGSCFTVRR